MSDNNANGRRNENEQRQHDETNATPGVIGGAALIGAGVGAIISGPLLAIGLGATAAGLCLSDNQAGDVARSTGRAGLAVIDKGKEIDERHGVTDKVKTGASRAWQRVRGMDREHRLSARAGEAFGNAMNGVADTLSKDDKSEGKDPTAKK